MFSLLRFIRKSASYPTVEVLGNQWGEHDLLSLFRPVLSDKESEGKCVVMSPYQLFNQGSMREIWVGSQVGYPPNYLPQMIWFQLVGHEHHFFGKVYNTLTAWSHIAQGRAPGSGAKVHGWAGWVLVGLKDHWRNWVIRHHGRDVFEENAQHIERHSRSLVFLWLAGGGFNYVTMFVFRSKSF